jgi:hypothetical protein
VVVDAIIFNTPTFGLERVLKPPTIVLQAASAADWRDRSGFAQSPTVGELIIEGTV